MSVLTGSGLVWSLVGLPCGMSGSWLWLLLRLEADFLGWGLKLFFLRVTAGFLTLIVFLVERADEAVVKGLLAVVDGGWVAWKTEVVARGILRVHWLWGWLGRVVTGWC